MQVLKHYTSPVVYWLTLWTLNPEIQVRISVGPVPGGRDLISHSHQPSPWKSIQVDCPCMLLFLFQLKYCDRIFK